MNIVTRSGIKLLGQIIAAGSRAPQHFLINSVRTSQTAETVERNFLKLGEDMDPIGLAIQGPALEEAKWLERN
jgi:hypothetical protein